MATTKTTYKITLEMGDFTRVYYSQLSQSREDADKYVKQLAEKFYACSKVSSLMAPPEPEDSDDEDEEFRPYTPYVELTIITEMHITQAAYFACENKLVLKNAVHAGELLWHKFIAWFQRDQGSRERLIKYLNREGGEHYDGIIGLVQS
jgi:hypothetical protein